MWKTDKDDEDWETDPDFINNVTEQEQRWGSKTIEGSGRTMGAIDMNKLREETTKAHEMQKQLQKEQAPNAAYGYGGKFGIEKDRMDKSAVGHDYVAKVEKHVSQTDYSTGFGGKYGIQVDRVDKSAVTWDHKENIEKHASQKDYSSGFGGKFGVEKDRQDKSAVGWDHIEKLHKHDSQTVNKKNSIILEQTQKPSQLRAKFESLAKQNEVQITEKKKPISIQKVVIGNAPTLNSNILQNADVNSIHKMNQHALQKDEAKQNSEAEELQEKMKQIQLENEQKLLNQELLNLQSQEKAIDNQEKEICVTETISSENLANNHAENEFGANDFVNDESLYEQCDELYTAIALYDYQAAADDEISFNPDDIITNIEKIDKGWWRGTCNGITGLFPANYVQLKE